MRACFALVLALTAACASAPPADAPQADTPQANIAGATAATKTPGSAAHQLALELDRIWQRTLDESIFLRLRFGLPIEHLPDMSFEQAERDAQTARDDLARLAAIDEAALDHEDQLSLEIARWQLTGIIEEQEFFDLQFPVTPYASPLPNFHRVFTEMEFSAPADAERYLRLLGEYPRLLGQLQTRLQHQAERGIRLPRAQVENVLGFLGSFEGPAAESFLVPDESRLDKLAPEQARGLRTQAVAAVENKAAPALGSLLAWLRAEGLAKAPDALGLWQYPNGERYYRFLVRRSTTLDLTPEQVHERGKAEVARIEREMELTQRQLGFSGPRSEVHRALREDPRYIARSSEDIGKRLLSYVAVIEPLLPRLFSLMPKAPYSVAPLGEGLAGAMTYGYYQSPTSTESRGLYYYNGSQPEKRTLLVAQSLILHELVPGHHFQITLQRENKGLHPLRANAGETAFVEGWGEYASSLGQELGLYQDPYERYGRLAAEMFLTTRLVVDTGLHHFRWTRQQAGEFMHDRTLESPVQIDSETLRYGADIPAQALAYKIGALKIRELRDRAAAALGQRYDPRDFHRCVLGSGSMPLGVLERHVEWCVSQAKGAG